MALSSTSRQLRRIVLPELFWTIELDFEVSEDIAVQIENGLQALREWPFVDLVQYVPSISRDQWPKSGYPTHFGFFICRILDVSSLHSTRFRHLPPEAEDFFIQAINLLHNLKEVSWFISHRDSGALRGDSPPITERIASVVSNHNLRCLHMARPTLTLVNDVSSPLLQAKFLQRLWCISMFFGAESQADRQAISCVNGGMHLEKLHIGAASSQDWIDLTFPGLQMLEFFFCYARMPIYTFVSRHPLLSRVRIRTVRLDYSTQGGTWRSVDQMVPWFKPLRDKLNFLS